MRPLRLQVKGFTAFREPAEIDFTRLDVFAISGPTGSGKSSLLDAMTYALYGRVERVGDRVGQLVSQGQPRMAVTLEFEVGRDRYRVTRSTPAARGSTKILLERFADGAWDQAGEGADRVKEAERILARVIGLTYDGFTRSVLLPQGKFAEFLVGDAKKRREILTELLGLSLFRRMAERAGSIGKESAVRAQERGLALEREYADVSPKALKEAKAAAKVAEERENALAAAAGRVVEILGRWQEAGRSAQELRSCAAEAEHAAQEAGSAAHELAVLIEASRKAEEHLMASASRSKAAQEALALARSARREADASLGTADTLGEARVWAHRLTEIAGTKQQGELERNQAAEAESGLAEALRAAEADLATRQDELSTRQAAAATAEAALEDARHADLVAAVSADLKAGDPCPVCGLPLDKAPKRGAASGLTKATKDRDAAAKAVDAARKAVSEAQRLMDSARREVEGNAAERERLAAAMAEQERRLSEAEASVRGVLGASLPDDPLAEIERRLAELNRLELAERQADREAADTATEVLKAERERDRVIAAIDRQADRLASSHTTLFDRATRATANRVVAPSIPPVGDSRDPAVLRAHAENVVAMLAAFAQTLADELTDHGSLEQRLLNEATQQVGRLVEPAPSLEALAEAVTRAVRAATADVATSAQRAEDLADRLRKRKQLTEEIDQLEGRARLFKALALELRADRLIAFLQAEALQVLAAAGSERLSSLSDGRYRLVCRDDEFLVVDTWNGDEERSVRTLSGGETFLASLALALALADQVRSLSVTDRARLESLFLDEGFGTLDPDSLRTVVDAIEQLAGDGRLVGVITHVQELAEQFPRVEVRKDRLGSQLEIVA
jgi:exonuclease SbcC